MVDVRGPVSPEQIDPLVDLVRTLPKNEIARRNTDAIIQVAETVGDVESAQKLTRIKESLPEDDVIELSEEDILQSLDLQKLGALPGDKIVNGNLRRLVSSEPRGEIITQLDIAVSPDLQRLGAEPGDMIEDGNLIKSGENDPFRNIMYDVEKARSLVGYAGDYLQSQYPLPEFSVNFDDPLNFIEFDFSIPEQMRDMTPQERRDNMIERRTARLEEMRQDFEPSGSMLGTFLGTLDPTVAVSFGPTLLRNIVGGAAYGSGYEIASQLSQSGEVTDPLAVAGTGAFGAAAVPVLVGGVKSGQALYSKLTQPMRKKGASKAVDSVNKIVALETSAGKTTEEALEIAKSRLNLSDRKLAEYVSLSGKPIGPKPASQKTDEIISDQMANDSVALAAKSKAFRDFASVLSTEVSAVSKTLGAKLKRFETDVHVQTGNALNRAKPFFEEMRAVSQEVREQITMHLSNRNKDAAKAIASKYSSRLENSIDDIENIYLEYADRLENTFGMKVNRQDFFSRSVKDVDGLQAKFGQEDQTAITQALSAFAKSRKKTIDQLTEAERANIINSVVQGYKISYSKGKLTVISPATKPVGKGKSALKKRAIDEVTPDMMQYYHTADEALAQYIRRTTDALEKQKFLGKGVLQTDELGNVDVPESIGAFLEKELADGTISAADVDRLTYLLNARFGAGEQGLSGTFATIRDLGYLGTIADPLSALVQLTDLAASGAMYGFKNTLKSMFGKKRIQISDAALERISVEFDNPNATAKILDTAFGAVGFKAIDRLGKETIMNSALRRFEVMARSPKGQAKLREEYADFLGKDLEPTLANLQRGIIDDNVKAMAINELSNLQPITKSEQAVTFLANANPQTRLLYMLKSFTIKQYDLVRREIYDKIRKGEYYEAARTAVALGSMWALAGASVSTVKDLLLNREVNPDEIPNRALWSLIGIFGVSKYMTERYLQQGKPLEAAVNYVVPATPLIEGALTVGTEAVKGVFGDGADADKIAQQVKVLPGGDLFYNWLLGGAEKYNERERQKRTTERNKRREELLGR